MRYLELTSNPTLNSLLNELSDNPKRFFESGRQNSILNELFSYRNYQFLVTFLRSEDLFARRIAIWLVSELGSEAISLAPHVLPLIEDTDRYIAYHAIESIAAMLTKEKGLSHHVCMSLESNDEIIIKLGMYLISNLDNSSINFAKDHFSSTQNEKHVRGLNAILCNSDDFDVTEFNETLELKELLQIYYFAAAARRCKTPPPAEVIYKLMHCDDEAISGFARRHLTEKLS